MRVKSRLQRSGGSFTPLIPNKDNQMMIDAHSLYKDNIIHQLESQIWVHTYPERKIPKHHIKNGKISVTYTTKPGKKEYYYRPPYIYGQDDEKGRIIKRGQGPWIFLLGPNKFCCLTQYPKVKDFTFINKERTKRRTHATSWRNLSPKVREKYCSCKRYNKTPCGTYPFCTAKVNCPDGGSACSLDDCANSTDKTSPPGFNIGNLILGNLPKTANKSLPPNTSVPLNQAGAVVQGVLRVYVDSFDDFKVCDKQGQCYKVCYSDGTNCPPRKNKDKLPQ